MVAECHSRKPQSCASWLLMHQNMKDSSCWIIDWGLNEKISKLLKGAKLVTDEKSLLTLSTSLGRLKQGGFRWFRGFTAEKKCHMCIKANFSSQNDNEYIINCIRMMKQI